jgi:hypothetical protein
MIYLRITIYFLNYHEIVFFTSDIFLIALSNISAVKEKSY